MKIPLKTYCNLQWPDQIHANDSILTFGYSETVLVFLLEAAKKLDFQVDCPTSTNVTHHCL